MIGILLGLNSIEKYWYTDGRYRFTSVHLSIIHKYFFFVYRVVEMLNKCKRKVSVDGRTASNSPMFSSHTKQETM